MKSTFPTNLISYIFRGSNYKGKLKAEDNLCYQWANYLREQTINGNLKVVWCHIPNESPSTVRFGAKLNALGRFAGVADYLFGNGQGMWAIEVKTGKNKLSLYQQVFSEWCSVMDVPFKVMYTMEEGIAALKEWKILE